MMASVTSRSSNPHSAVFPQSVNHSTQSIAQSVHSNRSTYAISTASGYQQSLPDNGPGDSLAHNGSESKGATPPKQSVPSEKRNSGRMSPSILGYPIDRNDMKNQYYNASNYVPRLLQYARQLRETESAPMAGFMECQSLRNINLIDLNNELARYHKIFLQQQSATADDLVALRRTLHDQAEAIRDYEYICSLDYLSAGSKKERQDQSHRTFPDYGDEFAFHSRAYRTLPHNRSSAPAHDSVRRFLMKVLPLSLAWSEEEKAIRRDLFLKGHRPNIVSATVERLARFLIAMAGALFILVPMYIMALPSDQTPHQKQTKNVVTTTVAVVLFAVSTSVALRMSSDQTLAATFGYAAVLMVFVGLSS